jgi:outer membrane protein assembly factor BamD
LRGGRARGRALRGLAVLLALLTAGACATAKKRKEAESKIPPAQIYEQAMKKMEKKKYYSARTMLQAVVPRLPPEDRDLLPRVQLGIADAFFKDRGLLNYGEALNAYRNFLTYFPNHEQAPYAQFMVGMSMFKQVLSPDRDQALTLKAIDEFRKVETVYPDSPYVAKGRQQIDACFDLLAEHERIVGAFYQRRRRWQAAIDRYQVILDKYPRFSKTGRVLFDQGKCFLRAGNREEAGELFERLAHDDPKNPLNAKTKPLLKEWDQGEAKRQRKVKKEGAAP